MNTEKTLKNSIISVTAQICTLALQFINRRVFIIFLDIEYLGYQSVFGNIFSILSIAELGVGSIISFHLYKGIATGDQEEIGKLMQIYKWIYRFIACVVLAMGLIFSAFVPHIVKGATQSLQYLYGVYFLQLMSVVLEYFLSYRRSLYAADQKEYKGIEIDLYTTIVIQIVQLTLLAIFKDYILYLIVQLSTTLIANCIIYCKTNREYPYLKNKYKISKYDIQSHHFSSDIRNFLVHKIAYAVYGGTDNIVISAFCGIRDVAMYGNYFLIRNGVLRILFYRLLNPVQAAIGNIMYSQRKREELWEQFEILDVFSFFFASQIGIGFLVFFQPAIQIWMGKEYLLADSFVIAFALTIYLGAVWEIVYKYRSAFGEYYKDRNCMLFSAVVNILLSVGLARKLGVTGVQIGTFVGFLPIAYGRIRFVVAGVFEQSVPRYLLRHIGLFAVVSLEGAVCYLIARDMPVSIFGIVVRFVIWIVVPMGVNMLLYWRNPHFKELCGYISRAKSILIGKIKMRG